MVTYTAKPGAAPQVSKSSPVYGAVVLSQWQNYQRLALQTGYYLTAGMMKSADNWIWTGTVVGGLGGLLGINQAILKVRSNMAYRNQRKAVRELEKLR